MDRRRASEQPRAAAAEAPRAAGGVLLGVLAVAPFLLLLVLVARGGGPVEALDEHVAQEVYEWARQRPALVSLGEVVAVVLHPWTFRGLTVLLAMVLWRGGRRREAVWAVAVVGGGSLAVQAVKYAVDRARPVFDEPLTTEPMPSFPSSHATTAALAVSVALLVLRWSSRPSSAAARGVLVAVGVGLVLITSADRIVLGVHYVSDVVGGWLLAAAVVTAATVVLRRQPATRPRGSGVRPDPGR